MTQRTIGFTKAIGVYFGLMLTAIFLISGCAPRNYLVTPERDKKVLVVEAGDTTGERSLKLTKLFQDARPTNLILNPENYVSDIKYFGGDISNETLSDLNKKDITFVILVSDLRIERNYNVEGCKDTAWTGSMYLDIAYDENGNFVERRSRDFNNKITTCWHNIKVAASGNFIIYDTRSASRTYQGNFPAPPSSDSVFSKMNQVTSILGIQASGSISKPKVIEGTCPKTSACWRGQFYSSSKNEDNPRIIEEVDKLEAEASRKFMAYIAKLSR